MVEELIQRIFDLRNAAHIAHWKADTLSKHLALGDFYEEVIDSIDKYVEAHQGTFGLVGKVEGEDKDVPRRIHDEIIWLNENREEISQSLPALGNIIDELTGIHMKTLYKLENLK